MNLPAVPTPLPHCPRLAGAPEEAGGVVENLRLRGVLLDEGGTPSPGQGAQHQVSELLQRVSGQAVLQLVTG